MSGFCTAATTGFGVGAAAGFCTAADSAGFDEAPDLGGSALGGVTTASSIAASDGCDALAAGACICGCAWSDGAPSAGSCSIHTLT